MNLTTSAEDALSITMQDVSKYFNTHAGSVPALQNINLTIPAGQFVSIIGKSGSGKSTLINMLTGIDRPSKGRILVGSTDLHKMSEGKLSEWRGHNMGVVFQFFQLLPVLTLLENILLPMDLCGKVNPTDREATALELLDMVGLKDNANKYPGEVSGGQQQSAAIARALANNPPILMADEPTGNLDSTATEAVFEIFTHLAGEGKSIVMVTHDPNLAARANHTIILSDGQLVADPIATALPTLPHPLMLKLTLASETKTYSPGQPVYKSNDPVPAMWIITDGAAHKGNPPALYEKGTVLSTLQLQPEEMIIASADRGVTALWVGSTKLQPLIEQYPALRALLTRTPQAAQSEWLP